MKEVEDLLSTTLTELKAVVNARTVVGDPVEVDGSTVIPVVKIAFGFGTGGGRSDAKNGGGRAATGAGASVEPVAFLIVDSVGTPHLETVGKSPAAPPSSRDRIIEMIREQVLKRFGGESKEDESDDNGQG